MECDDLPGDRAGEILVESVGVLRELPVDRVAVAAGHADVCVTQVAALPGLGDAGGVIRGARRAR